MQRSFQPPRQEGDEVAVGTRQQAVGHFDDGNFGAERRIDGSQFEADVPATDDEQSAGNLRQVERAGGIHDAVALDAEAGNLRGM